MQRMAYEVIRVESVMSKVVILNEIFADLLSLESQEVLETNVRMRWAISRYATMGNLEFKEFK